MANRRKGVACFLIIFMASFLGIGKHSYAMASYDREVINPGVFGQVGPGEIVEVNFLLNDYKGDTVELIFNNYGLLPDVIASS